MCIWACSAAGSASHSHCGGRRFESDQVHQMASSFELAIFITSMGDFSMDHRMFLSILSVAEKLKCTTRHCDTSSGRRESVAEHSWRLALMAMLLEEQFAHLNIEKVIKMCLIHDLGEAFTGDIATFYKTDADTQAEDNAFSNWINTFPEPQRNSFRELLAEMNALETDEAKLYKALDKLEAVIQHNESDIDTWLPLEYDLQLTYGADEVKFSPYITALKSYIDDWTRMKIETEGRNGRPK